MITRQKLDSLADSYANACTNSAQNLPSTLTPNQAWRMLSAALDVLFVDQQAAKDTHAYVGDLEEERNQARENEAVALRDQNDIEIRLDEALERAQAFEVALFACLKMREKGTDENLRRIGELLQEVKDTRVAVARLAHEASDRAIERCVVLVQERGEAGWLTLASAIRALKGTL